MQALVEFGDHNDTCVNNGAIIIARVPSSETQVKTMIGNTILSM